MPWLQPTHPVWRVLLPLVIAAGLLWGFGVLADEIAEGETHALEERILLLMRTADPADPIGPAWVEEMARDLTALGGQLVLGLLVLLVASYMALHELYRLTVFVLGSLGLGFASVYALKLGFDRPRPEIVAHGQEVYTSSFPSGHSMGAALTYLTLAALLVRIERRRRVQVFVLGAAVMLAILVGLSRVYLGVHYPTDVLGGWAVGAAWAVLSWVIADWLARSGHLDERPGEP